MKNIKISLLYNHQDERIEGKHWKLNNYRFFVQGLSSHKEVELETIPIFFSNGGFDCSFLKCDAVILWSILAKNLEPMNLKNFENLQCPKITRAPDAWEIDDYYNKKAKELGINLVVSFQSPDCQYTYLDKDIYYKRFILGIDSETYKYQENWYLRRADKILSTGVLSKRQSLWFYHFRTYLSEQSQVLHVPKKEPYLGVNYWKLLNQFRAAIACMSFTSVLKYFEIPMCGCLMFAESTKFNQISQLGFKDGINCIFIDKGNWNERFNEFLKDPDNIRYKIIADKGRQHVLNNFTNEREVDRFVQTVKRMVIAGV